MKYATWKLDFTNPDYGTGPEQAIADSGAKAEAAWVDGSVESGGTILGYITGDFDLDLSPWNYAELSQAEALAFCLQINPDAFLLDDGRITSPRPEV